MELDCRCYDAPMQLIGQKVEVRYLPDDPEKIWVFSEGKRYQARLTNRIENGKTKRENPVAIDCTKSLARWLALRTIRSPLFLKNKSSSFFVYVILLSYHTQTIRHKRTAMLMLSCFFILNNYISDFFIRPPPFRCLFLLFLLQTSFILGGSLWTNILILTER